MRVCPVCQQEASKAAFTAVAAKLDPSEPDQEYAFRRCAACDSFFIAELPDEAVLASFYESERYHTQGDDDAAVPLSRIRKVFYDVVHKLGEGNGRRLLDIGCGPGLFLEYTRVKGWQSNGMEYSDAAARAARARGFETYLMEERDELLDRSYDAVSMIHVLEHLQDPGETLAFVSRILRPGGRLLLELPALHTWEFSVFGNAHGGIQAPIHLQFFSDRGLADLAARHGLQLDVARNNSFNTLLILSLLNRGPGRRMSWGKRVRLNVACIPLVLPFNLLQQALGIATSMRVYQFTLEI